MNTTNDKTRFFIVVLKTLSPEKSCPAAATDRPGTNMSSTWIGHYTERAVKRLQHFVTGAELTPEVVYAMQAMCPYETYALGMSDFCPLFTRNEWDSFEYAQDLRFQGDYGFMSPTGRAQGAGWTQEFVARLKGEKISQPYTFENTTLVENPEAFPLDQRMYLDFGHDNLIISVLAALNFTSFDTKLDPLHRDRTRNFIVSHIAPFAARLFFEVLECSDADGEGNEQYVRAILNDALLPMSSAQSCSGRRSQHDGLCLLDKFIKAIEKQSLPAADYAAACFNAPFATDSTGRDATAAGNQDTTLQGGAGNSTALGAPSDDSAGSSAPLAPNDSDAKIAPPLGSMVNDTATPSTGTGAPTPPMPMPTSGDVQAHLGAAPAPGDNSTSLLPAAPTAGNATSDIGGSGGGSAPPLPVDAGSVPAVPAAGGPAGNSPPQSAPGGSGTGPAATAQQPASLSPAPTLPV